MDTELYNSLSPCFPFAEPYNKTDTFSNYLPHEHALFYEGLRWFALCENLSNIIKNIGGGDAILLD